MNSSLRILVADPHPLICEGIAAVLAGEPDIVIVWQAASGSQAIDLFCELKPDVLVMERHFPDMDGCIVLSTLTARFPDARILVLSRHEEEEHIYTALQAGAKGYYSKAVTGEALAEGVRRVCAGKTSLPEQIARKLAKRIARPKLTGREREVLGLIVDGKSNQELAAALFITEGTVKSHMNSLLAKLGVSTRTQAVLVAIERGLAGRPALSPPNGAPDICPIS